MLQFTLADVRRAIDPTTFARGEQLQRHGMVREVEVKPGGTLFIGTVQGSERKPYRQLVSVRPGQGRVIAHGTCSCPVRINCKHVAAVLLEALQRQGADADTSHRSAAGELMATLPRPEASSPLSPQLSGWLRHLDEAGKPDASNDYPVGIKERLIYVLDVETAPGGKSARVRPMVATMLKSGGFGSQPRRYHPESIHNQQPARFLRPIDHEVLRELAFLNRMKGVATEGTELTADLMVPRLLTRMLATGRCRWREVDGPLLAEGPARKAQAVWKRAAGGRQILAIEPRASEGAAPAAPFDAVLPLAPPHYVDSSSGTIGPLELELPAALAARIVAVPEVPPAEAAAFAEALEKRLGAAGIVGRLPLPEPMRDVETRQVKPVPRLELFMGRVTINPRFRHLTYGHTIDPDGLALPLARLRFDYAGTAIAAEARTDTLELDDGGRLVLIPRDRKSEAAAVQRIEELGFTALFGSLLRPPPGEDGALLLDQKLEEYDHRRREDPLDGIADPSRFIAFSAERVPELIAEGWQVTFSTDYPYRIAEGEAAWWADIGEGSGIDWFSFELGIEFEGERLSLVGYLASIIPRLSRKVIELATSPEPGAAKKLATALRDQRFYCTLPDGRLLPLPGERLAPMLKALLELVGPRKVDVVDGKIALRRAEAAGIAAFAETVGANVAWAASAERLLELGRNLQRGRLPEPVTPPASFKASLRPYQADGLAWLEFLRSTGFGGALADDMGLGKTVQALAFLCREKAEGRLDKPALIVSPTSVLPNWQAEAARFAPELRVLPLRGSDRHLAFDQIPHHDLVLTTYPLLMRDHEVLLGREFHAAILDEAQAIKNPKAAVSAIAHRIDARHRIALTGTPLENNLGEVWSLFQFLAPGLLGDETTFRRTFRTPIEKHGDRVAQAFLTRRLKPFMLRRTKAEVAKELPPKTEIIERIRLEGGQRDLYETVRSLMHKRVRDEIERKGLAKSHIVFLDALLKLRQVCCDPRLLKMPHARKVKVSAKLERLVEMLPELIGEGRRILLFSQFTSMLALIEAELAKLGIPYVMLTGDTVDRATPVKAFQSGEAPLFLLSLKAGGTGLNLTAADTVIHYDPWWNPAVENQATDRAHRIGQDKPVFVYKLIVEEGIEEAIELLKARKAALAEALFEGSSKSGLDLTEADIAALFAPLEERRPLRRAA